MKLGRTRLGKGLQGGLRRGDGCRDVTSWPQRGWEGHALLGVDPLPNPTWASRWPLHCLNGAFPDTGAHLSKGTLYPFAPRKGEVKQGHRENQSGTRAPSSIHSSSKYLLSDYWPIMVIKASHAWRGRQ